MKIYKPKFSQRTRTYKGEKPHQALFVTMPNDEEWNIWNLSKKECTPAVIAAIKSAFERGWRARVIALIDSTPELEMPLDL